MASGEGVGVGCGNSVILDANMLKVSILVGLNVDATTCDADEDDL